jgi:hypothetical protein
MVEIDLIMRGKFPRKIFVCLTYVVVSPSVVANASVPPELVDTESA